MSTSMADSEASTNSRDSSRPIHTTLYVLIPPSALFAAHWSFFIPDLAPTFDKRTKRYEELKTGRRIHVTGDRLHGYELEIIREYDLKKHRSVTAARRFAIGSISGQHLDPLSGHAEVDQNMDQVRKRKDDDEGGGFVDNQPRDAVEKTCIAVKAPDPSLRSAATSIGGSRSKIENRDCQWWVKQVVAQLVEAGQLCPLQSARSSSGITDADPREVVSTLPVH